MKLRTRLALGALALVALLAVPALAAPDQSATLSAATPAFSWQGAAQITHGAPVYNADARTAIPCKTPARPCDYIVLNVIEPGKLSVKVAGDPGTGGDTDPDLYLYESDKDGTQGKALGSSAVSGPDAVTYKVTKPGYYLVLVDIYHGYNSGYKGAATFASSAPPAAAPPTAAPPATTAPQQTPNGTAKPRTDTKKAKQAACKKKAKKIKNAKKRKKALKRCSKIH